MSGSSPPFHLPLPLFSSATSPLSLASSFFFAFSSLANFSSALISGRVLGAMELLETVGSRLIVLVHFRPEVVATM